ncbi:MAG: molybdenum cofactor biosynthesis protein C [Bdellovibrionales bacterium RIFOXYD1_FULL_53_11]|nr:MAG: molybdenum cofactor biosynthesis protein C [Bdellovibrionales bacterium RIFOXYD1_FULL_53_11]
MKLSHVDSEGRANMVDVSSKDRVRRTATATGIIRIASETMRLIRENGMKKGDVLVVAEIAGIQAAKRTAELVPLCHNIQLGNVQVRCEVAEDAVCATCTAVCVGQTGVEMEALTGVTVALLTVYDMCKAVDKNMRLGDIRLVEKKKEAVPA